VQQGLVQMCLSSKNGKAVGFIGWKSVGKSTCALYMTKKRWDFVSNSKFLVNENLEIKGHRPILEREDHWVRKNTGIRR